MYDPKGTFDVLDPNTGEVFGRIKAGRYTDIKFRGPDRKAIDGEMDGLELKNFEGKVMGRIEGDSLVQDHSGIAYPLRPSED